MTNLKEQFYQTKNIEFLKKTLGRELWVQVSGSKDINTNTFYEIEENGECTEVAKIINNDCAYIKLKSLMKFAAAKQMALLLFFDIRVKISGSLQKNGLKEFSTTVNEDGLFFGLWGGEQRLLETYSYSILMGKRILLPKPVEECGYEPYSRNEEILLE